MLQMKNVRFLEMSKSTHKSKYDEIYLIHKWLTSMKTNICPSYRINNDYWKEKKSDELHYTYMAYYAYVWNDNISLPDYNK